MDKLIKFNKKFPTIKWHILWVINLIIMVVLFYLLSFTFKSNVDPDLKITNYSSTTNAYTYIYVYNFKLDYIRTKIIYCILCTITVFINFWLFTKNSNEISKLINKIHPILKLIIDLIMLAADIYMIYLIFDILLSNEFIHYYDMTFTYFAITIVVLFISIIILTIILMTKISLKWDKKIENDNKSIDSKIEESKGE